MFSLTLSKNVEKQRVRREISACGSRLDGIRSAKVRRTPLADVERKAAGIYSRFLASAKNRNMLYSQLCRGGSAEKLERIFEGK
jgi:hypothetical protein